MGKEISRRSFLKAGTTAALGLTIAPNTILGKVHGHTAAPSDKLNILGVGIGGDRSPQAWATYERGALLGQAQNGAWARVQG